MDPTICWAEDFISMVCGPALLLWICVAMMALLTDRGYHHLIITISALLAQAPWSCALAGEDTQPALLSPWFPVYLPCGAAWSCCSLTGLRISPFKTSFCSSGCEGIYSPTFQEISWIGLFLSRAQVMWGTSGSYKLKQLESILVTRFHEIKPLLGLPKYTHK